MDAQHQSLVVQIMYDKVFFLLTLPFYRGNIDFFWHILYSSESRNRSWQVELF